MPAVSGKRRRSSRHPGLQTGPAPPRAIPPNIKQETKNNQTNFSRRPHRKRIRHARVCLRDEMRRRDHEKNRRGHQCDEGCRHEGPGHEGFLDGEGRHKEEQDGRLRDAPRRCDEKHHVKQPAPIESSRRSGKTVSSATGGAGDSSQASRRRMLAPKRGNAREDQ